MRYFSDYQGNVEICNETLTYLRQDVGLRLNGGVVRSRVRASNPQ